MQEDTICAPATSPVNSPIAVIRISGPEAFRATSFLFPDQWDIRPRKTYYRTISDGDHLIDDVIIIFYQSPESYTGEDMVELFCHGNFLIVNRVLSLLNKNGIRLAQPGEFTKRAFLNGKVDLTEAEAINHIITARSDWEIETSLKQMHGSLKNAIREIKDLVITLKADIEARIDFSTEDIQFLSRDDALESSANIDLLLNDLLLRCQTGERLSHGINITITGKPNVGKSSILNLLLNQERAIVSSIPGTTRDVISESIQIDGMQINLSDTAGIDTPGDEIEEIGINLSKQKIETASILLMVFDASTGFHKPDRDIMHAIEDKRKILLINKTDIAGRKEISQLQKQIGKIGINISAKTGEGFKELRDEISKMLKNEFATIENTFVADLRMTNYLKEAIKNIGQTKALIDQGAPDEIIAFELQALIDNLSGITGEITPDDILDSIFSRFCIGK